MILITGSAGLIGCATSKRLADAGIAFRNYDVRDDARFDTCNKATLATALQNVTGVIHLAAVSRVVWAEEAPALARAVNVDALENLLQLMQSMQRRPWLIFASSREVYGEQANLPVSEDATLTPLNTYARTKVEGERLVEAAKAEGLDAQIVRFSNVYGSIDDHEDRVVPAFARTAAMGGMLRVDGSHNMFDFTHVDDAAAGLMKTVEAVSAGETMPPLHFLTGAGTTLGELADLAQKHALCAIERTEAPPRKFDVSRFVGNPARAEMLLGWRATVSIDEGFKRLVVAFAESAKSGHADQAMIANAR